MVSLGFSSDAAAEFQFINLQAGSEIGEHLRQRKHEMNEAQLQLLFTVNQTSRRVTDQTTAPSQYHL